MGTRTRTTPIPELDRQGLKAARLTLRLTLEQAEQATGIKWASISDWESGRCGGNTATARQRIHDYLTALCNHAVGQGISPERCFPHVACPSLFAPPLAKQPAPQEVPV